MTQYRHNHYVPVWYQKRFLPPGATSNELHYLDLTPGHRVDGNGRRYERRALRRLGFHHCFAQNDLYTVFMRGVANTEVERRHFGDIDDNGRHAVEFWSAFEHNEHPALSKTGRDPSRDLMEFMSTLKLRTPKGLGWLDELLSRKGYSTTDVKQRNMRVLSAMVQIGEMHCATWMECVWQIAHATNSSTKFLVSDHPVTAYNRRCGPKSQWCRGFNDPDIWMHGTHTIFPLTFEKVLILTNRSWARNPYQSPIEKRPNPGLFRDTFFHYNDVQVKRELTEREVLEINFVIKSRALRYVAAAKEEWLYPERTVSKSDWSEYGDGLLLMPDPRALSIGGTVTAVMSGGRRMVRDDYGRSPGNPEFERERRTASELPTLYRFQGEFAKRMGPNRRGQIGEHPGSKADPARDSDKYHAYLVSLAERFAKAK